MVSSWLDIPEKSDFSIHNFPFGVFRRCRNNSDCDGNIEYDNFDDGDFSLRCGSILGDYVIDLSILEETEIFSDIQDLECNVFNQSTLNSFLEHPKSVWLQVRQRLIDLFKIDTETSLPVLQNNLLLRKAALVNIHHVQLVLPIQIGDYTDFYSSREHATNVGIMFRGAQNSLQPNWLHLPVGYHGRSSTVCVSGTPIRRPCGQLEVATDNGPPTSIYGPTTQLDFELEVAAVIGGNANEIGTSLTIQQAKERIFGFVLMNDWSARDIQKWEYVPLGPFTSKNFATTISPWIVMTEALDETSTSAIAQTDPVPLPYLRDPNYSSYDVRLSVSIQAPKQDCPHTISETNFRNMYWNSAQQLVHHTVTGCSMKAGDLLGSGTISGTSNSSFGSMLELSWKGTRKVPIGNGNDTRTFLNDGDTINISGFCTKLDGSRVGFGECTGTVQPPKINETGDNLFAESNAARFAESDLYQDFTLYGYWRSSSTWRVRIALASKSIPYENIPIDLTQKENKSDSFREKSILGQVPLLECRCRVTGKQLRIAQSLAIITFLDEAFPTRKSLLPKMASKRAATLAIAETVNSAIQPWQNVFFLEELSAMSDGKIKANDIAKSVNEKGLQTLEVLIENYRNQNPFARGPYSMGTFSPSLVDAFLIPQIYNARRFGVDVDSMYPTLAKIDLACSSHPWFEQSHPNVQPDAVIVT
jgi:fumarylacetoacetase